MISTPDLTADFFWFIVIFIVCVYYNKLNGNTVVLLRLLGPPHTGFQSPLGLHLSKAQLSL